jgi:rubrerythrin
MQTPISELRFEIRETKIDIRNLERWHRDAVRDLEKLIAEENREHAREINRLARQLTGDTARLNRAVAKKGGAR